MAFELSPWGILALGILIGWLTGWGLDLWFERQRQAAARQSESAELRRAREQALLQAQTVALRLDLVGSTEAAIEEEPLPLRAARLSDDLALPEVEMDDRAMR